jgi:hypothetical protein
MLLFCDDCNILDILACLFQDLRDVSRGLPARLGLGGHDVGKESGIPKSKTGCKNEASATSVVLVCTLVGAIDSIARSVSAKALCHQ